MKCSQCSAEIPQESEFCLKCGAKVNKIKQTQTSQKTTQEEIIKRDKTLGRTMIAMSVLSMIIFVVDGTYEAWAGFDFDIGPFVMLIIQIGLFVSGVHLVSDKKPGFWAKFIIAFGMLIIIATTGDVLKRINKPESETLVAEFITAVSENTEETDVNPEYKALTDKYLGYIDGEIFLGLESESFAKEHDGSDTLEVYVFAYKDDVIKECKIIQYADISDFSEESINNYEKNIRTKNDGIYGSLDFAEINYNRLPNYFSMTISITGIDDLSNLKKLADAGAADVFETNGNLMSMKETTEAMLEKGYVQK